MRIEPLHVIRAHWLDHEMDVPRPAVSMRPQTDVHLIGIGQFRNHGGRLMKQRPELREFFRLEIGEVGDMADWFDDQRAYSQWADAVLDHPSVRLVDRPTRRRNCAGSKVAG